MFKFALLGKNIQHSKSPEIYKRLISPDIQYDLIDCQNESEVPGLETLLNTYDGINITSPYKKMFLSVVIQNASVKDSGAINCLKKIDNKIIAENTDYMAILDILNSFQKENDEIFVAILGDGVMSQVTQTALNKLSIPWEVFSRKVTLRFSQLNLDDFFNKRKGMLLVINTCSREFVFEGKLPKECVFWDYNYSFNPHLSTISPRVRQYLDGHSMLLKQAEYAVAFWSGKI